MLAEILRQTGVGDVVGHPQRDLRNHRRELVYLDPEKAIDVEAGQHGDVRHQFHLAVDRQ